MKRRTNTTTDTDSYSMFYSLHESELEEVSDEAINSAYNYFDAERMKYYHDVYVRTDRNFTKKKNDKPGEWNNFASVIRICKRNNFHLRCYIKYCFINNLVPKSKGRLLSDISYLRNYPQVIGYARNKAEIERLYDIYMSIMKSIFIIKKLNVSNGLSSKESLKKILSSGKLGEYISTGTVSLYFLALIKNITLIIHKYHDKYTEDESMINDICRRMENYGSDALKSMNMFYPSSSTKTIIQLCSE